MNKKELIELSLEVLDKKEINIFLKDLKHYKLNDKGNIVLKTKL